MVEFVETSILELVKMTEFVHLVKPSLKDKLVYALKKPEKTDRSAVFYLMPMNIDDAAELTDNDIETVILSAEFIVEHPFWNKGKTK
jgi:hypothetical protein